MKYGTVTGIDKQISRIGQGCMMLETGEGQDRSNKILDAAWETGIRLFDHSHVYGAGDCERAFGVWLKDRGVRDEAVILDKGCHPYRGEKRVTPARVQSDVSESLGRLGVESIDLWLFHRDDPEQEVGPLVETLTELIASGRVGAWGCSNWTHTRIAEAIAYAESHGLHPPVASSPNFSLAEQVDSPWGPDCVTISGPSNKDARDWYVDNQMPVFAWSSLARGFLSGRLRRDNFERVKDQFEEHVIRCYVTDDNWERLDRAAVLATKRGLSIPQIAIAYVLHHPMNTFALVAAYTREEAEANIAAVETELSDDEVAWLDLREG